MKGLFLRIDPDLDRRLSEVCRRQGLKKGGLVSRLIVDFLQTQPAPTRVEPTQTKSDKADDPLKKYEAMGVDLGLLWASLAKTPTERAETNYQMLIFKEEARKGREKIENAAHSQSR